MSENMNGMSAGNTADKTYANTKYKDTFFRYLFKEKSGMLELYNALFDDCLTDESEIEDCTIEDVFTRQMKNDLAFRVRKKRVIVLTEHQSTLNENMPLRFLMYLGRTYNQMMTTNAVYKERRIELDAPEFVVFYNGDRNQKEYWEMHLSDAFPEGVKVNIDLRVRVYNINYGKNSKLLQQTKLLSGYSYFVDKIKHLCKNGSELKEAIDTAVRECIKEGVLTDQLTYLGSEVMGMFATEFDMDEAVKVWKEEAREEGLEEGREEGAAAEDGAGAVVSADAAAGKEVPGLPPERAGAVVAVGARDAVQGDRAAEADLQPPRVLPVDRKDGGHNGHGARCDASPRGGDVLSRGAQDATQTRGRGGGGGDRLRPRGLERVGVRGVRDA